LQQAVKQVGNLTLRSCHTVPEFQEALQLQKDVWNFTDIELVPVRLFVVGEKIGGHVLGAFDGDKMVGFAYGIPGYRSGHAYLHSHMLGVAAGYRNTGVGASLKWFQREIALQQGFDLIEWTFDPLEIKNAFLNLEKLGAIARRYVTNQYGITSSPLQAGLPSDRLVAEWWLRSKRVEAVMHQRTRPEVKAERAIDVPAEIYSWKADPEQRKLAIDLQSQNREMFQDAFAKGLACIGYERDPHNNGTFLLGHWDEKFNYPHD
jgi:predicted GNAT superfamily acetyltransferase